MHIPLLLILVSSLYSLDVIHIGSVGVDTEVKGFGLYGIIVGNDQIEEAGMPFKEVAGLASYITVGQEGARFNIGYGIGTRGMFPVSYCGTVGVYKQWGNREYYYGLEGRASIFSATANFSAYFNDEDDVISAGLGWGF